MSKISETIRKIKNKNIPFGNPRVSTRKPVLQRKRRTKLQGPCDGPGTVFGVGKILPYLTHCTRPHNVSRVVGRLRQCSEIFGNWMFNKVTNIDKVKISRIQDLNQEKTYVVTYQRWLIFLKIYQSQKKNNFDILVISQGATNTKCNLKEESSLAAVVELQTHKSSCNMFAYLAQTLLL